MRPRLQTVTLLFAAALALSACTKPGPPAESPVTAPGTPGQTYTGPTPASPGNVSRGEELMPGSTLRIHYQLREGAADQPTRVTEVLLREEGRVVAAAEGKVYAVWLIRPDGVWRKDPKGPALLRYLPDRLEDGLTWKQTSGDADVWFKLNQGNEFNGRRTWAVTMLNRGERTTIPFAAGIGPISAVSENHARPSASFVKMLDDFGDYAPSPEEGQKLLAQAPLGASTATPEVVPVSSFDFAEAGRRLVLDAAHGLPVLKADLDGDGVLELVLGQTDQWSDDPVTFFGPDGTKLKRLADPIQRIREVRFQGSPRAYFLHESGQPDKPHTITLLTLVRYDYSQNWEIDDLYGWEPKTQATTGNRVTVTPEGRIRVEWDMGDPARHTRVREYQLVESEPRPHVRLVDTRFRPEGTELRYPTTHADLVTAVFFARWFSLTDELPRYFATPDAAAAFGGDGRVGGAEYGPGTVTLGVVEPPAGQSEELKVTPGPVGPDGTVGFAASVYGYEWGNQVWGTISFGSAANGRLIIKAITIEGYRNLG